MKTKAENPKTGSKLHLLREASNQQAAAKVGLFGDTGSGKTTTAGMLALGLALTYCKGRAVAMMDTESASDFLLPIVKMEGVQLLTLKSRAFSDLLAVLDEAERAGCAALIVDSITHTWTELQESYCRKKGISRPEFQHWRELKQTWGEWTAKFLSSPLHIIVNGRLGFEYEYQENETGKKELIKGDSKMRAEGQFGYEPHLLVELEKERDTGGSHRGGRFIHRAHVLKDRSWALNGKEYGFPDKDGYAKDDWKTVFNAFAPHFQLLNIGGEQQAAPTSRSDSLFGPDGTSEYYRREREKRIALEEIESTMVLLWPGQDAKSKRIKLLVVEAIFSTRSWESVTQQHLDRLHAGLRALRGLEAAQKDTQVSDEVELLALVRECVARVAEQAPTQAAHAEEVRG